MRFSIVDRRRPSGRPVVCDVSLGQHAPEATLAEVLDRVVDLDPRLTPIGPDPAVDLDGVPVPAASRLADLPLRIRLPRDTLLRPVPGREYLVDAGGLTQIQAARMPALPALAGVGLR